MQLGFRACVEATIRLSVNIQIQRKFSAPNPCVPRIFCALAEFHRHSAFGGFIRDFAH